MKRKYVPCKKDFQLFLCLMRHIINTITLFGKFHILQVYRRDFLCLFSNSVTHLSTCLHMHTFDTIFHEDTMFLILPFFLFWSPVCGGFNDTCDDGSWCTCKNSRVWIDSAAYLKICVHLLWCIVHTCFEETLFFGSWDTFYDIWMLVLNIVMYNIFYAKIVSENFFCFHVWKKNDGISLDLVFIRIFFLTL